MEPDPPQAGFTEARRRGRVARRVAAAGALAVAGPALSSCVDTTGPPYPLIETTEFAASLGVDLPQMTRIGGGIYILDLAEGSGAELTIDHRVGVSYTTHLADGTLTERENAFSFRMACHEVVPGFEAGARGMKVGGLRRIVVPGRLGYGSSPPPGVDVREGSILVYDVEAESSVYVDPERSPC